MVDFYGTEEHVIRFLTRPEQNVCTDGLLGGKPHPRVFGSFPRVLGKYVREEKALTLEDAIRKMTAKPAEVFGFEAPGTIEGRQFCRRRSLQSKHDHRQGNVCRANPVPVGIEYVLINGQVALSCGRYDRVLAGKVLRKSQDAMSAMRRMDREADRDCSRGDSRLLFAQTRK